MARQIVEAQYRAFRLREKEALWWSQRDRACGVFVLIVRRRPATSA